MAWHSDNIFWRLALVLKIGNSGKIWLGLQTIFFGDWHWFKKNGNSGKIWLGFQTIFFGNWHWFNKIGNSGKIWPGLQTKMI